VTRKRTVLERTAQELSAAGSAGMRKIRAKPGPGKLYRQPRAPRSITPRNIGQLADRPYTGIGRMRKSG